MNQLHLCAGCMANKGDSDPCPECGWREGTQPESAAQLPARTILLEKYMLGRVLGQGGFGITYLAWDLALSRKLAIKEYFPREICVRARDSISLQPTGQRNREDFEYGLIKFKEEGQNLARFRDYPGIVSLLEYFESNGTAYIVMAYMEGMTFKQYLQEQGGKINFDAALAILTPVMDALREVHSAGMLHRDISPDNIYLNRDQQVKILDFGATRYAMRDQSQGLTVIFKPGYAPFEQYSSGGKQGTWTDVYAVGATFYRALTGNPPAEAPDRMAHDDLVLPSAMGIKMPLESEPALFKALAVHWQNRFQRMEDFQKALTPSPPPLIVHPRANRVWMIAACVFFATTLTFAGLWLAASSRPEPPPPPAHGRNDAELQAELQQTQAKLDQLNREDQSLKGNLSQSAKSLSAVMTERDALQSRNQELTQSLSAAQGKISDLLKHGQRGNPNPPPQALSAAYLQLFEWDRLSNTRNGPAVVFRSAQTRRILCAVGGPNPSQGSQPFSGQIAIEFIAPGGATKTKVGLGVHTTSSQATWAAMAYWGNDQAGTLEKGVWRVQVSSGSQVLKSESFVVN
jgi:serine/threonine protein kinase